MVTAIRDAEKSIGRVNYELSQKVQKNKIFDRSRFVVKNIKEGELFTAENVRSIRPNYGLMPVHYKEIIGAKAKKNISAGTPLSWELIEKL